jgi:hypothetical protein
LSFTHLVPVLFAEEVIENHWLLGLSKRQSIHSHCFHTGCKKEREEQEREAKMETAGGTKKRSPTILDEQPLPPLPSPGKRRCTLANLPLMNITEDGQTDLHLLCQDPSTSVEEVRASLEEYPDAPKIADVYGRTAIFYALKRACLPEVVQLVFAAYPDGVVLTDFCGESALYLLYHPSKHPSILKSIFTQQPSLALHRPNSFSGKELVDHVCDPWAKSLDQMPTLKNVVWTKLVLTVQAAHRARFHETRVGNGIDVGEFKDNLLHMALELQLSPTLLYHFARLYPDQARRPMPRVQGLLPLQYVVQQTRFATAKGTSSLVRQLVEEYPEAATLPCLGGRYPLHLALSNNFRWCNGVKELVYACPAALHEPDPLSNLLPFMIASTKGMESDMNTVFCLLREGPLL